MDCNVIHEIINNEVPSFKKGDKVYFIEEELGSIPCEVLESKDGILTLDNGYDKPFEAKATECEYQEDR